MRTNEYSMKDIRNEFSPDPEMNAEARFGNKYGSRLKKIVLIASLAGAALLFNSCTAGYVASEPSYMQYERPGRPNEYAIWISGDWSWNSRSQTYYQNNGYWDNPRPGKTYVSGHWDSSPRGKSWSKGYWQSEGSQKNKKNHNHNHEHNEGSY